jgi:hypothetical protein
MEHSMVVELVSIEFGRAFPQTRLETNIFDDPRSRARFGNDWSATQIKPDSGVLLRGSKG